MEKRKIIYIIFLSTLFAMSNFNIKANDEINSILVCSDQIDLEEYLDDLFPEMEDEDIIFQVNNGGYLFSTKVDSEQLKDDFLRLNKDAKLKELTVKEAKDRTKYDMIDDYLCGRIELTEKSYKEYIEEK